MSRDYQGPYYSLDDLRSVIDAMCKSIESSGLIDEHEHPSAYSALLDTSKWMAELEGQEPVFWYRPCSDGETYDGPIHNAHIERVRRLSGAWVPLFARPVPAELSPDFTDTARAALLWVLWHHQGGSSPVGQPIRYALGMDAHEHLSKHQVQEAKRWAALTKSESNDFRQARTAPPEPVNARLLEALKIVTSQLERVGDTRRHKDGEFIDLGREAIARAEAAMAEPQPDADGAWKASVIDQLIIAHILTAEHANDPLKAVQDLLAFESEIAIDPRVSKAAARLVEQARAEEREACAKVCDELFPPPGEQMAVEWAAGTIACANAIRARGHG